MKLAVPYISALAVFAVLSAGALAQTQGEDPEGEAVLRARDAALKAVSFPVAVRGFSVEPSGDTRFALMNISKKPIRHVHLAVEVVDDQGRRFPPPLKLTYTGILEPGESGEVEWKAVWKDPRLHCGIISAVEVAFTDGTMSPTFTYHTHLKIIRGFMFDWRDPNRFVPKACIDLHHAALLKELDQVE